MKSWSDHNLLIPSIDDKLRLLLVFQLRFPSVDMNMITEKTIGVKGIDGMAGLKVFSKQGAPQDQSHPEVLQN